MPAFALRFVGQEALPPRLSEFDREQFFTLTSADVAAIREQFRSDHRLPAALMLMFMRVAGRPLDGFNVLPRNLLRHTAQVLAVSPPSIASLRSIYKRRQTLFKHQRWAKTYLGLRELEIDDEAALTAALESARLAGEAPPVDIRTHDVTTFVSHGSLGVDERRQAEQAFVEVLRLLRVRFRRTDAHARMQESGYFDGHGLPPPPYCRWMRLSRSCWRGQACPTIRRTETLGAANARIGRPKRKCPWLKKPSMS